MAEQAHVYVKNKFTATGSIQAFHKLPDGSESSNNTIDNANQVKIVLLGLEEWIEVNAPQEMAPNQCWLAVKSDVDVQVVYSENKPNWTIKIAPNSSHPNTPTDMNVTVGDDEPE